MDMNAFLVSEEQAIAQNELFIVYGSNALVQVPMFAAAHLPCSPAYHIIDLPPRKIPPSPVNSVMSEGSSSESEAGSRSPSRSASPTPSVSSTRSRSAAASHSHRTPKAPNIVFTTEERKYLEDLVQKYIDYCDKPESVKKGARKAWILKKAVGPFMKVFRRIKDNEALREKIERFFYNKTGSRSKVSRPRAAPKKSQKPRKTNPKTLFARDHEEEIKTKKAALGAIPHAQQLDHHNKILIKMWEDLEPEERQAYIDKGTAIDEKRREMPTAEEIDENQRELPDKVLDLLNGLSGYEWGQSGDFVFFVLGAYKNSLKGANMKVFSLSGGSTKASTFAFSDHPDYNYEQSTKIPFAAWASDVLTSKKKRTTSSRDSDPAPQLAYDDEGHPLLPEPLTIEDLLPQQARGLVTEYLEAAWKCELSRVSESLGETLIAPVPWGDLDTKEGDSLLIDAAIVRRSVGKNASLNPHQCSDATAIKMLEFIYEGQKADMRTLDFLLTDSTVARIRGRAYVVADDSEHELLSDSEIEEVEVGPVTPRKRKRDASETPPSQTGAKHSQTKASNDKGDSDAPAATESADKQPPEKKKKCATKKSAPAATKSTDEQPAEKKKRVTKDAGKSNNEQPAEKKKCATKDAESADKQPAEKKKRATKDTKSTDEQPAEKKKRVTKDTGKSTDKQPAEKKKRATKDAESADKQPAEKKKRATKDTGKSTDEQSAEKKKRATKESAPAATESTDKHPALNAKDGQPLADSMPAATVSADKQSASLADETPAATESADNQSASTVKDGQPLADSAPAASGSADADPAPKRKRVPKTFAPREASRRIHDPGYSNSRVMVRPKGA